VNQPATRAVVDIDGVLADARHRLHMITGKPTHDDWVGFFRAAEHDPLLVPGAELVHQLATQDEITYLTGRPDWTRELTQTWLDRHELPTAADLLMKTESDARPARVMKRDTLVDLRRQGVEIRVAVDDDPRVVALLDAAGFPTMLADWVHWSPVLLDP
jgi:hypothetical protein